MNSQDFLILNVACGSLFILWYWRSRGAASKRPTQLNMHAPDSVPLVIPPESSSAPEMAVFEGALARRAPVPVKSLNVIFNYNGHSWDAYEVLGIPAGSPLREVTQAYQRAVQSADPASQGFLETAYKAILHRF